ncbi:hypothetical protein ASE92_12510 [Pedobacter sp. Leaf41]|uniref:hypothetical protein n=1 Tax=Pedobacter sp. Leaf41 TaxID=1736218 RepID=UPI0007026ADF|nr:hypothetical protein [Pedobacter sp. Leaf41]KQN34414.1 hypothetical protein ASE92_12510 [Pedobacter sp. Leaf41]
MERDNSRSNGHVDSLNTQMLIEAIGILKKLEEVFYPKKSNYITKKQQLEARAKQQIYSNLYAKKR